MKENKNFLAQNADFNRLLENRTNNLRETVAKLVDFEDLTDPSDKKYDDLIKSYRVNLIRCDLIAKLETELDYARYMLEKAMRKQINLKRARQRVEWLENEIEKTILTNKNVFILY